MILVIDNYDSFTYNLVHYLIELGTEVEVVRNDAIGLGQAMGMGADALLLSPGPCTPNEAGISLDLIAAAERLADRLMAEADAEQRQFRGGGAVVRADKVMHGKTSPVSHDATGVFAGLPSPFEATRYHSLVVRESDLPACLEVNARTPDGAIMGLRHRELPIHGVQFHPESIATQHGHQLLANFLDLARVPRRQRAA